MVGNSHFDFHFFGQNSDKAICFSALFKEQLERIANGCSFVKRNKSLVALTKRAKIGGSEEIKRVRRY